jgi:hypothetical protein
MMRKGRKKGKKYNKAPRISSYIWRFQKDFKIKTHTHLSNHVQSDNEDFVCASGSLFVICTCSLILKVCVFVSLLRGTLFSNDLFDESW